MYKATNRKASAKRLSELTGMDAVYTRMPRCAYEIGDFTIERDGMVVAEDGADLTLLETLVQEGLLEPLSEATEQAQDAPESMDDDGQAEEPETRSGSQEGLQDASEHPQPMDQGNPANQDEERAESDGADQAERDTLSISLPITGHTASSLRSLIAMVYSRGNLISKATGGYFSCTEEQVEILRECITIYDVQKKVTSDLQGIVINDDTITFAGFPFSEDPDKVRAFTQLAAQMNRTAKKKRTVAKRVDETNERYSFRIWLLSLGMAGDEFKTARKVLLAPLSGSMAFKDKAMEQRFRESQRAKKKEAEKNSAHNADRQDEATASESNGAEMPDQAQQERLKEVCA